MDDRRPAPPVTVVVPGQPGRPGEVLAQGGPEPELTGVPGRRTLRRRQGALLLGVLGLTAVTVAVQPADPPLPEVAPNPLAAVQASSQLLSQDEQRVRLLVEVRIAVAPPATGLQESRPASAQVLLEGLSSPGLVVRLPGRPLPVPLGYLGRTGTGVEQVVRLTVDAVALGCAQPQRPRRLALEVSRGAGGAGVAATVPVRDRAEVTDALEGLVRRSCGGADADPAPG